MNMVNRIGLDANRAKELADRLNVLLANYTVFYMNVRGFHWNIKGDKFFDLHVKFENLYNDLEEKIDEIAERVLTLGHTPVHTLSDYLRISEIKEVHDVTSSHETVTRVLDNLSAVIRLQREILAISGGINDEGTSNMIADYIQSQEKLVWMFSAFLASGEAGASRPGQERRTGSA